MTEIRQRCLDDEKLIAKRRWTGREAGEKAGLRVYRRNGWRPERAFRHFMKPCKAAKEPDIIKMNSERRST